MTRYVIIHLTCGEYMQGDLHDLMIGELAKRCDVIASYFGETGAEVFFSDSVNDLVRGRSFARVESNFSLTEEQKAYLIREIKPFFVDGEICEDGMNISPIKAAICFCEHQGELISLN